MSENSSAPLFQLVYISRRRRELNQQLLGEIVARSEQDNRRQSVTGVLLCRGDHIMQLLEGALDTIQPLFARIAADPRHHAVECLLIKPVDKRLYPEWGMRLAELECTASLDRMRMSKLIHETSARNNTAGLSLEARMLLSDFDQQIDAA